MQRMREHGSDEAHIQEVEKSRRPVRLVVVVVVVVLVVARVVHVLRKGLSVMWRLSKGPWLQL